MIQDSIPDDRVITALVSELEFKHRKNNGASLLSYPVGLSFFPKHSRICFESMGVECYFKEMQADHDMPTVANYAYRRARCGEDDMLHIYQKDFSYFTGPSSFYPEKIIIGEPPNIKTRPSKQSAITEGTGSKEEDTTVMREFAGEYGRGVRQENVPSKTKVLTGTLPYTLSMCPTTITASTAASLEKSEDVTTACKVVDANVALRTTAVRCKLFTRKKTYWQ